MQKIFLCIFFYIALIFCKTIILRTNTEENCLQNVILYTQYTLRVKHTETRNIHLQYHLQGPFTLTPAAERLTVELSLPALILPEFKP